MYFHLLAAIGGAVIAASGTGVLTARCFRTPSVLLVAWTGALLALAVALVALTVGYGIGFGQVTFRAMELGAQVVAPIALLVGLAEIAAKKTPARFGVRLILGAVALVALVILGTDPLSPAVFSKAFPVPSVYYQIIPNKLLEDLLAPLTIVIAVTAVMVTAARPGRDPAWRKAFPPAALAGCAALLLAVLGLAPLLAVHLGISIPLATVFTPICGLASALVWLAAMRAGNLRLDILRDEAVGADEGWDSRGGWDRQADQTGDFEPLGIATGYDNPGYRRPSADPRYAYEEGGSYGRGTRHDEQPGYRRQGYGQGYEAPPGFREAARGRARDADDYADGQDYAGTEAAAAETWQGGAADADLTLRRGRYDWQPDALDDDDARTGRQGYGEPRADFQRPDLQRPDLQRPDLQRPDLQQPERQAYGHDDRPAGRHAFGQIAIYTLLEDRVTEFDRLTKEVVRRVRTEEPDTLVYIFHAVPAAPMQRILYEVYRDRAAYEEHKRRSYVARFEADRRPYVLATNVIELGLKQAKVSPVSTISDLLSDTGFDLLRDTGFGSPGYGPRPAQ
jgi:quinol monooxygenase YgiN